MLTSIYTGLTGLVGFSNGLNVISNNVANINTPGYKGSTLQFQDLYYSYQIAGDSGGDRSSLQIGSGVGTGVTTILFQQGELRDTQNPLDVAIDGNGFFILRKDGNVLYTRAGQFGFDSDGYLIDKITGARVAALGDNGELTDINIDDLRINPPVATTEVTFVGNLSTGSQQHLVPNMEVYDALGDTHDLSLTFINNSATTVGSWTVEVRDDTGTLLSTGEIRFQGDGTPEDGFSSMTFTYAPAGANPQDITLDFGTPGSTTGATNYSTGTISNLQADSQNGREMGALINITFTEEGYLELSYSNGETIEDARLALAWFDNLQSLEQAGNSVFINVNDQAVRIDAPGESVMGKIAAGKIEMSNVELTGQFTDMVIIQRGYQASSQVISVSNEMIQQLFDMKARR